MGSWMRATSTVCTQYLQFKQITDNAKLHSSKTDSQANAIVHYQDQTDIFYTSPLTYLRTNFPVSVDSDFPSSPFPSTNPGSPPPGDHRWDHRWPSHLVFFGALLDEKAEGHEIESYLKQLGYQEVWVGDSIFEEDWRRRGGVRVWRAGS